LDVGWKEEHNRFTVSLLKKLGPPSLGKFPSGSRLLDLIVNQGKETKATQPLTPESEGLFGP
jgi:hypothetical protein